MDFTVTDSTTLEDLLGLQLHFFEEEVRSIVDKAVKEMAIEKVLLQLLIQCYSAVSILPCKLKCCGIMCIHEQYPHYIDF